MENLKSKLLPIVVGGVLTMVLWWLYNRSSEDKQVSGLPERLHTSRYIKLSGEKKKTIIPTVVVGPSGVGKGTLLGRLMKQFPGVFGMAVSHTTRAPRKGEVDAVNYNFVNRDQFLNMVAKNEFIEHAEYGRNLYGTSIKCVEDVAKTGKICLLEINLQGAQSIKALGMEAWFLFITTSGDTLSIVKLRLRDRGSESKKELNLRLAEGEKELEFLNKNPEFFDRILENDNIEEAFTRLRRQLTAWYQL